MTNWQTVTAIAMGSGTFAGLLAGTVVALLLNTSDGDAKELDSLRSEFAAISNSSIRRDSEQERLYGAVSRLESGLDSARAQTTENQESVATITSDVVSLRSDTKQAFEQLSSLLEQTVTLVELNRESITQNKEGLAL